MILIQDLESLQRITGLPEIPPKLEEEYELRLRLYHADGNSGPLGSIGLIDLVRFLGYGRTFAQERVEVIDWRQYPQDGSVRVEAKYFGGWMPGAFRGFVADGLLAIKLDDEQFVKECRRDMVRLAENQGPIEATDNLSVPLDAVDESPATNWSVVDEGEQVYVDDDGNTLDGVFVRVGAEGPDGLQVLVQIDGEEAPREFLAENVAYAGEPKTLSGAQP